MRTTRWKAVYKDGTILEQHPEGGKANTFRDIDQDNVVAFSLFHREREYTVLLEDGRKLVYTKRTVLTPFKGVVRVIYILGWQKNVNGENVQSLFFIEDDKVLMAGKWGKGLFSETK
jgi:hypothetical protein